MSYSTQKSSDKLHIIDRSTYEKIQQQSSAATSQKRVHNAKYKKTTTSLFSLFQFIKPKVAKQTGKVRGKRVLGSILSRNQPQKKGKTREAGRKKYLSRIKRNILVHRQRKCQSVEEARQMLDSLTLCTSTAMKEPQAEARTATHLMQQLNPNDTPEKVSVALPTEPQKPRGIHSRQFRDYCDNCTTPQLRALSDDLIRKLYGFQKRAFVQNEIKARAHRRLVIGFRELQNFLRINKVKLVIIAPDCEAYEGGDGLHDLIQQIKSQCQEQNVPYVFSLKRRELAYALYKKSHASCVGILDYDGARDIFGQLIDALGEARELYAKATEAKVAACSS